MSKDTDLAAIEVARRKMTGLPKPVEVTAPDGTLVKIIPVSAALLEEVQDMIKDPPIPEIMIESKGRTEKNPEDPTYLSKLAETNRKRGVATMNAMIMMGIDLPNGLPEDENWITKLRYLEKIGAIDLSSMDFDDQLDREFAYKKHILASGYLIDIITSTTTPDKMLEEAEASFPGS